MKSSSVSVGAILLLALAAGCKAGDAVAMPEGLTAVPFQDVHIQDSFWSPRIEANRRATIEANLHQCEITGRIKNFAIAGGLEKGKHQGQLYNDSDVYKMIEGIAYALSSNRDPELERRTDQVIDKIAAAQGPDGYLNTYVTLVKPQDRWKNIQFGHELYCAGHLIEAAVAYNQATNKRKLLDVASRLADHIAKFFGPDGRVETSGHEEIELALVKLYRATGKKKYLDLAEFFLDVRGRADRRRLFGEYHQDHMPIKEQAEVSGHAVRAMYLYSAVADVAAITKDKDYIAAMDRIWHDIVDRKMYITGGIGPSAKNEGFTVPYDLPNDTAYAETCAAVGMALWNHRLFLMSGDGKYADVLEREVYNGLISGVSQSGDRFFYVNPLGSKGNHHRVPWFDCSCCPTNVVRYVPGMGERVYAHTNSAIWTVLYMGSTGQMTISGQSIKITQRTRYPWEEAIEFIFQPQESVAFDFFLRVPGWYHKKATVAINGRQAETPSPVKGYIRLSRTWQRGDTVRLTLPMQVERVYADPHVKADRGRVALQRGPVVYCLEGVDNEGQVRNMFLPRKNPLTARFEESLLGGVVVIGGKGQRAIKAKDNQVKVSEVPLTAIPYYAWDNRQPGQMILWIPENADLVELPANFGEIKNGTRTQVSSP
jgi:DUF1680 family protein